MTIPKSYEALAADLASEKILSKTLIGQKEAYMMLADQLKLDLATWKQKACEAAEREAALREELAKFKDGCVDLSSQVRELEHKMDYYKGEGMRADALQQRLTVAEQLESEAREELLELSRKLDVFYSRSHGIKNLSEIEKANDEAKNLKLKVREYEDLLNISKELLTTISRHGSTTKPVDWCDSFKAEVADRIEKIGAALKPAEGEGS